MKDTWPCKQLCKEPTYSVYSSEQVCQGESGNNIKEERVEIALKFSQREV